MPHAVAAPAEERLVEQEVPRLVPPSTGPPAVAAVGRLEEDLFVLLVGGCVEVERVSGWMRQQSTAK
jgi:hypothetical protein